MNELEIALSRLLSAPGVIKVTLGPLEDDSSIGIRVMYETQVGVITHMTAADSIPDLARRFAEITEFELDPR